MFWQRVLEREPHRQFLGKLRHPLSLLVQILILLALILALARPEPGLDARAGHTVVVIDARARMQADEGRVFRDAVQAAQGLAARASSQAPVAVLAVAGAPEVLSGFSGDNRALREKLAALRPSDAGGGMEETLALAERLLASQPGENQLVVITDRALPESAARQFLTGRPEDNAAILALAQRPVPSSPQSAEVFVKLGNFSKQPRNLELELTLDGRIFELQKFPLAPGDQRDFSLTIPAEMRGTGPGGLTARLTGDDGLALDNSARALLATGSPLRVLLLTANNPFLEGALNADPGVQLEILDPSLWKPELAAGFDAVIFDGKYPEGLSWETGRYFFFGRSPFEAGEETVTVAEPERTDPQSPLFWNVRDTGPVRARLLREPGKGWRTEAPLKGGGAPLVLAVENQAGARHVATAFGVDETMFPLRPGFPIFVSNVVRWLAGRGQTGADSWKAGQSYLPAAGEKIALDPRETPAAPADPAPSLTEAPLRLKKQGYYEVRDPNQVRWIAVNTASAEESDLRQSAQSAPGLLDGAAPGGLLLWQWIALLALLLLLAEWWLHQRRITE